MSFSSHSTAHIVRYVDRSSRLCSHGSQQKVTLTLIYDYMRQRGKRSLPVPHVTLQSRDSSPPRRFGNTRRTQKADKTHGLHCFFTFDAFSFV
ncbi:hypothetical protein TsFJ059_005918 [Trichoderma semiorbis]|uniref:Uncharacterized protein n=1 Tax=Trichoderma semiorbis TaxID=1491008 RepID=A0A9P8HCI9_9HYPO|nr:hypothetical protein TsFJ059_005918 [Trichoderma semiorbis]